MDSLVLNNSKEKNVSIDIKLYVEFSLTMPTGTDTRTNGIYQIASIDANRDDYVYLYMCIVLYTHGTEIKEKRKKRKRRAQHCNHVRCKPSIKEKR